MNVGVIGAGHVGLPTAAVLAHLGHVVAVTDADHEKIEQLAGGTTPFYEPGLTELIAEGTAAGRLSFSADPTDVIGSAEIVFICVGTPPRADGEASLLAVEQTAETVGRHAQGPLVVVEKSTVPAGTADRVSEWLTRHRPDGEFALVSNPEFLREGSAVQDSLRPSRILIGSDEPRAFEVMRQLYQPLLDQGSELIETDVRTAELAKHASNAFLALKVSFANALARISELAGADVVAVTEAMGADDRIGRAHLHAGLGYGGYCFPKDLAAFERLSSKLGYDFPILREVARINEEAMQAAFQKVEGALWNLEQKRVVLLGLSFKPLTDDVRFAPALELARRLIAAGASVVGYDPQAAANAKAEVPELDVAEDLYASLEGAHCAVVCTEWPELRALDLERAREVMAFPIIVDGRNALDPAAAAAAGFTYLPTGRPAVSGSPAEA